MVYDPFVGTGSILVAASHFGAVTFGADIDVRVVRDGHVDSNGQVVYSPPHHQTRLPSQKRIVAKEDAYSR